MPETEPSYLVLRKGSGNSHDGEQFQVLENVKTEVPHDLTIPSPGPEGQKSLHDSDNHDGVITHLEPDMLKFEVKWALGSIIRTKLVEMMELQLSYFNPKRWCCESAALNMSENLENSAVATGLERSVFIQPQRRAMPKMFKLPHSCIHFTF